MKETNKNKSIINTCYICTNIHAHVPLDKYFATDAQGSTHVTNKHESTSYEGHINFPYLLCGPQNKAEHINKLQLSQVWQKWLPSCDPNNNMPTNKVEHLQDTYTTHDNVGLKRTLQIHDLNMNISVEGRKMQEIQSRGSNIHDNGGYFVAEIHT